MKTTDWPVYSDFAKEHYGRGKAEGEAKGEAEAILLVLKARGLPVTDMQEARITGCSDIDTLKQWVSRAAIVAAADDLFG